MAGVQCCDVSHDESMIVSCDVSSYIKVSNYVCDNHNNYHYRDVSQYHDKSHFTMLLLV